MPPLHAYRRATRLLPKVPSSPYCRSHISSSDILQILKLILKKTSTLLKACYLYKPNADNPVEKKLKKNLVALLFNLSNL